MKGCQEGRGGGRGGGGAVSAESTRIIPTWQVISAVPNGLGQNAEQCLELWF